MPHLPVEFSKDGRSSNSYSQSKVKKMLRQPEAQKFADRSDSWRLTQEEAAQELTRLCNVREKILAEIRSLEAVYKTVCDRNDYVRGQLRAAYATVDGKDESAEPQALGPYRFPYARLETWGILVESNIPEVRYVLGRETLGIVISCAL